MSFIFGCLTMLVFDTFFLSRIPNNKKWNRTYLLSSLAFLFLMLLFNEIFIIIIE